MADPVAYVDRSYEYSCIFSATSYLESGVSIIRNKVFGTVVFFLIYLLYALCLMANHCFRQSNLPHHKNLGNKFKKL